MSETSKIIIIIITVPAAGRLSTTNFYWQRRAKYIWLLINAINE